MKLKFSLQLITLLLASGLSAATCSNAGLESIISVGSCTAGSTIITFSDFSMRSALTR